MDKQEIELAQTAVNEVVRVLEVFKEAKVVIDNLNANTKRLDVLKGEVTAFTKTRDELSEQVLSLRSEISEAVTSLDKVKTDGAQEAEDAAKAITEAAKLEADNMVAEAKEEVKKLEKANKAAKEKAGELEAQLALLTSEVDKLNAERARIASMFAAG
jgi:chromosome segregation ATPase